MLKGVRFGDFGIGSLLFADDVSLLLASLARDLQLSLELFAAKCEAAGIKMSTSKSEAMLLSQVKGGVPLVGEEILSQVEKFKSLRVSRAEMEREIDRRIGVWQLQLFAESALVGCGEEGPEPLNLPVDLLSYPHICSQAVGGD